MRLIDADRLLKILEREEKHHSDLPQRADGIRDAIMDVISAPTVDAVPVVHGRWIKMGHIEHTWLVSKCSVCGNQTIDAGTYCTNCGAKMDGKNGEQA